MRKEAEKYRSKEAQIKTERSGEILQILFLASCLFASLLSPSSAAERLYSVEFRNADIKAVVRMLAQMSGQNIVVPETLEGNVTASFEKIDLDSALNAILKTHGYGFYVEQNTMLVVSNEELEAFGQDLIAASFSLKYAKAEDILPHLETLVTERGTAVADERTNSVHVRDTPAAMENIRNLIASIDTEDRQVLIEAKIVDASVDFVRSLGVEWGISRTRGDVTLGGVSDVGSSDAGTVLNFSGPAEGLSAGPPAGGLGLLVGSVDTVLADMQLSVAEEKGEIQILSRPSVTTLNNHPAKIRSGVRFFIVTSSAITVGETGDTSNLQEIETGIELSVTPQISVNDFVKMEIEATESEADFSRAIEGIPAVIDSTATTTVMLKDGETTVIGGLYRIRESESVRGVPGLMRVPILGYLFKNNTKTQQKSELLIFITPKIIEKPILELPHFEEPESAYYKDPETRN